MEKLRSQDINSDTIVALSSPYGVGAIALIRLSGADSKKICDQVFRAKSKSFDIFEHIANTMAFGEIVSDDGQVLDEVVLHFFESPHSFSGEDIIEITCHASVYIQNSIIQLLINHGARAANPGEFTMRAFLNGKMDLAQAEAVADLIQSDTALAHNVAMKQLKGGFSKQITELREQLIHFSALIELELDFSEEDVEFANKSKLFELLESIKTEVVTLLESYKSGNVIKNGIPVAIIGKPNVGKSTLLNILLNEDRAIVSEIPGTTRDSIEDTMVFKGINFRFIDTAGLRHSIDEIENIGIEKTMQKISQAMIILYLFDYSESSLDDVIQDTQEIEHLINDGEKKLIYIANKIDNAVEAPHSFSKLADKDIIYISAKRRVNINLIIEKLIDSVDQKLISPNATIVANSRHFEALTKASLGIEQVENGLKNNISGDLLASDIHAVLHHLGEITGTISNSDILNAIFDKFCIGK
jgi:tRNA modification GTPase